MKNFLYILFTVFVYSSCISHASRKGSEVIVPEKKTDPYEMIREGQAILQDGDLVVRLNQDPTSQIIKNFNRHDKTYSHAGLVFFENGYPFIFHIVNGEENPEEIIRKDSMSRFGDPRKNLAYGIFRYDLSEPEIKKLKSLIKKWHVKKIKFDREFDLKTDNRMYCSEMIGKALNRATGKRISIASTELTATESTLFSAYMNLHISNTEMLSIVSIDNLYKNKFCSPVKEYKY